jgi:RNA polymerase sigma-54 factor
MSASDEMILCEVRTRSSTTSTRTASLRASLDEIANLGPSHAEESRSALAVVQSSIPAGIASRDLTECLRMQLRTSAWRTRRRRHGARPHEAAPGPPVRGDRAVHDAHPGGRSGHHVEIIKHLDPKPGVKYSPDRSAYILPTCS